MTKTESKIWYQYLNNILSPLIRGKAALADRGIFENQNENELIREILEEKKLKVLRQKIIDNYIVDFYIPDFKLVIEID